MALGDASLLKDWTLQQVLDALQKLCHDLLAVSAGGKPRFFEKTDLPQSWSSNALSSWGEELTRCRRTSEHPFNTGLMLEALVDQAQTALNSRKALTRS